MNTIERSYDVITREEGGAPVKMWTRGVPVDEPSKRQLLNTASMPFIYKWLAVMPDVHYGKGSTIGSVIPTKGAIIPAAVGVDIGCGMMAVRTSLARRRSPRRSGEGALGAGSGGSPWPRGDPLQARQGRLGRPRCPRRRKRRGRS